MFRLLEVCRNIFLIPMLNSVMTFLLTFFFLPSPFWSNLKEVSKGEVNLYFCVSLQTLPSRDASFPYKTQLPCMVPASALSSSEYSMESKILDYVQELDSSFHPVLSFPSGK